MDDREFSGEALKESFRFIKFINLLGGGQRTVFSGFRQALRGRSRGTAFSVLDVGCGIGDMGRGIIRWGKAQGFDFAYTGLEPNEEILNLARNNTRGENIRFIRGNLFDNDLPEADLVVVSMVLHHLGDSEVVTAIQHLSRKSKIALIINDLERSTLSYLICSMLVFSMKDARSRYDALLSIKKGFTLEEIQIILKQCGLRGSVRRALGWRLLAVVPKS